MEVLLAELEKSGVAFVAEEAGRKDGTGGVFSAIRVMAIKTFKNVVISTVSC